MAQGSKIIDHHCSDFYPERWFDLVVVLQTDNTVLYDRLAARGYHQKKITDNVECEIFGTVAEEARNSYKANIIMALQSDTMEQHLANAQAVVARIQAWTSGPQHHGGAAGSSPGAGKQQRKFNPY